MVEGRIPVSRASFARVHLRSPRMRDTGVLRMGYSLFQGVPAMLGDSVVRLGITEDFGARRGREIGLALKFQHPQLAELAVLEYLHFVHVLTS